MRRRIGLAVLVLVAIFGGVPLLAQQNPMSRIVDVWQGGCISCHSTEVMGQTLNATMSRSGHPNITRAVTEIPNGCTMCHKDGTLGVLVHTSHYRQGVPATAPLMPCMACHTMDAAAGMPVNKNAPANW
jgi:hypothetical protein